MDIAAIRKRIEDRGLRQVEIATALDMSSDKVSKMLAGVRRIQADEMAKLRLQARRRDAKHFEVHPWVNRNFLCDNRII